MKRSRTRPTNSHWTSAELKRLDGCYARMSGAELDLAFPRHTPGSIRATANARGLFKHSWMAAVRKHVPKCDLWGRGVFG